MKLITTKAVTARKSLPALIVSFEDGNSYAVFRDKKGEYHVTSPTSARLADHDFPEAPFLEYLDSVLADRQEEARVKQEEAQAAERQRLENLKSVIRDCPTPHHLADVFDIDIVETGEHWSDLLEGRSRAAFLIASSEDKEIIDLAIELHRAEGEWGEACRRDGAHHSTFTAAPYDDLSDYQAHMKDYYMGTDFIYRSPEDDAGIFAEKIRDILDGDGSDGGKMEDIAAIMQDRADLVPGYYNCNGNLAIADADLEDPELTGYHEDVYTYNYAYRIDCKGDRWNGGTEDEE